MKLVLFKKTDLLWWVGLVAFWFIGRFLLTLSETIKGVFIPSLHDIYGFLAEGVIFSTLGMATVIIRRRLGERDEVKEKKVFWIRFVWHKKYLWGWIGMTIFWGVGQSLIYLYHEISPPVLWSFIKGGIFCTLVYLVAGFWEGNPGFFGGQYKNEKKDEK